MQLIALEIPEPSIMTQKVTDPVTQNEYSYYILGLMARKYVINVKLPNGQQIELDRSYPNCLTVSDVIEAHRADYLQPHFSKPDHKAMREFINELIASEPDESMQTKMERREAKQLDQDKYLNDLFNAHQAAAEKMNDLYKELSRLHIESLEIQSKLKQHVQLPKNFGTTRFNIG